MVNNFLYDVVIKNSTNLFYDNVLAHIDPEMTVLDVGFGNGLMLEKYNSNIIEKKLQIWGIDANVEYVKKARKRIKKHNVQQNVQVIYSSFAEFRADIKFDVLVFSMTWLFFEDELLADFIANHLKQGGKLLIAQTLFHEKSQLMEWLKPNLKYITTIDFGRALYKDNFFDQIDRLNLRIFYNKQIAVTLRGKAGAYFIIAG